VTAKILRLDGASCLKRKSNLRLKTTVKYTDSSELAPAPIQGQGKKEMPPKKAPVRRETPDTQRKQNPAVSETKPKPQVAPQKQEPQSAPVRKPSSVVKEANLLDGDDTPSPRPVPVAQKPKVTTTPVEPPPAPTPEPAKTPTPPPAEPALSREELVAKREALVQEQVDAALEEKRKVFKTGSISLIFFS
jgi:hypothetical protein